MVTETDNMFVWCEITSTFFKSIQETEFLILFFLNFFPTQKTKKSEQSGVKINLRQIFPFM